MRMHTLSARHSVFAVVRDFARSSVGPEQLRANQRLVSRRLLSSTPESGWLEHSNGSPIHEYVASSLRFHLTEAVGAAGVEADTELLSWVEVDGRYMSDFFARECANVIGADLRKAREGRQAGRQAASRGLTATRSITYRHRRGDRKPKRQGHFPPGNGAALRSRRLP